MEITKLKDLKSQKGYQFNQQYFVAYEGNSLFDATNQDYLACLEFIKNGGKLEPEFTQEEYLKRAKDNKLAQLEAFILSKKTEPFTTHTAPEIIGFNPYVFGADVKFIWYVDAIPNSNLTPESILNKCTLDTVDCINGAINNSADFASFKVNYANFIKQKVVPYTTIITKNNKQVAGVVNIFPVVLTLANHIQQREISNNILLKIKQSEINNCKSVEEVEAIKFE